MKKCILFAELGETALGELSRVARRKAVQSGEILFSEGDSAGSFYLLTDGAIDLIKPSPDGREKLVRSVKRNEVFAEAAMFSGVAYPATAVARSRSEVHII